VEGGFGRLPIPFWIPIMEDVFDDVARWVRPHDVKSWPVNASFCNFGELKTDRISLRMVSRATKFKRRNRSVGSIVKTWDITRICNPPRSVQMDPKWYR
jgi:hypothetical protein